ncbi:MAG: hypothetical protein K8I30_09680, partial [Anaerolineae bacterium]|nr:hypothetical protein [Anaerolineae bacterium]
LHAVYTLLEQVGWYFEITGPRCLPSASLNNLSDWSIEMKPAVNYRGIRQHINFPMDISGYPLPEALDYIRNLARLRLNHITFHSYQGQWYDMPTGNPDDLAGHFFYGDRYDIPDHSVIRAAVRNQKTFCIPDIEPVYDQPEERGRRAIAWLQAVIAEAKRVGLQVQFSFELREQDTALSLATIDSILRTYPQIDALEMITQETGGWGQAVSADELRAVAARWLGDDILRDPEIAPHLVDGQTDLHQLIRELGHYVELCGTLKARGGHVPKLSIGIYCVTPQYHQVLLAIMRRYVPAEVGFTFLLNHGNRAVAQNARDLALTPADWQRSMVYSWIEFDGTMYLQQNALTGIRQLIQLGRETNGEQPINGISLNHWRTAENRTCIRYAALALLQGAIAENAFYGGYAASFNLDYVEAYLAAMLVLDRADT